MNQPTDQSSPGPSGLPSQPFKGVSKLISRKAIFIALICGLLQIPLHLINGVTEERQTFNVDYPLKYKGPGAGQQTVTGPVLTVPYRKDIFEPVTPAASSSRNDGSASNTSAKGKDASDGKSSAAALKFVRTETGVLHFFPESLNVSGSLTPELRDEGKFKSILYTTTLDFKGNFDTSDIARQKLDFKDLQWQDAYVALGLSDLRGIRKDTILDWSGRKYRFVPGTNGLKLFENGQHALLNGPTRFGKQPFSFTMTLSGSRDLNIFPAGKENQISLQSPWTDPTFTGGFLPTSKKVDDRGFYSTWEVSYFTRNIPQVWTDADADLKNSLAQYMVGVSLATPVEFYRTAIRAVKYGNLFIIMTFLTFFIFEVISSIRIHEIQYMLVGLALSLFFLMLIAISEWVPFSWAYVCATIPTVAQITCYTYAFSRVASRHLWKVMALTLTVLYGYLYVLLQMESLSLLSGAIGLFIALSIVLYVTRNINWYQQESALVEEPQLN